MFSTDALGALFAHMEWADLTVWRAALALDAAARDTRLRELLLHIHAVQRAFLCVWTDQPVHIPEPAECPHLAEVYRWGHTVYPDLTGFVASLHPEALSRPVQMPWLAEFEEREGRRFELPTLAETMFQVTSHSTHHRGQVNARLRELGAEPPLVDFIAWVWLGKPAAPLVSL